MEKGVVECEIFGEIFGGFNLFLGYSWKRELGEFQIYFFWGEATLGKGSLEIWDCFGIIFCFFGGGKPWKRESIDLRLRWDYFLKNFYRRQALKNAVWRFEIALGFFLGGKPWKMESGDLRLLWDFFLGGKPWKMESGDLRLLCFFLKAALGKGSLEVWDCFGITFDMFFWEATLEAGSLEIWDCFGTIFFWEATLWKRESGDLRLLWDYFLIFWVAILWKREVFFDKLMLNTIKKHEYFHFFQNVKKKSDEIWWKNQISSDFIRFFFFRFLRKILQILMKKILFQRLPTKKNSRAISNLQTPFFKAWLQKKRK